jgi:hypothetical protein
MTAIVTKSTAKDPQQIAAELATGLGTMKPTFLLLFSSSKLDAEEIGRQLGRRFPNVPSLGCTTAGELACTEASQETTVLLGADAGTIEKAVVASVPDSQSDADLDAALEKLSQEIGHPLSSLDPAHYLGLVLQDGLGQSEERVMEVLSTRSNVGFVGGSAGDDLAFDKTRVMADFQFRPGSCALALLVPARPFTIVKTQSLSASPTILEATEVDEKARTVRTFNGKPALEAYAEALGTSKEEAVQLFIERPLGLVVGPNEVYTRSPQQVTDDGIRFYCQVKQGMKLHLLDPTDIVETTQKDLTAALESHGSCSAMINFNCIQRTLLLRAQDREAEFAKIFDQAPMIGFATYGESYVGHINQTATIVLLG